MTQPLFVGIDTGSSATKCIVLDGQANLIGHHVVASGFDYAQAADQALTGALAPSHSSKDQIERCVATGYGRQRVAVADRCLTEITCHARGAREWYPATRNIIDIGGQDTKIIRLDGHGQLADYRMNTKCAAGTGTFLESIAVKLGMPLSELDALAMQSNSPTVVNSYCTVFAGTEVLERIKDGQPREDIALGLFRSIANRIFEMLSTHDGPVAATGGVVTHCKSMVRALQEVLKTEILLPPMPQHAGAYGAALAALQGAPSEARPLNIIQPRPEVQRRC